MKPLVIHGGSPAFPEGPPAWPLPDPEVRELLRSMAEDGSWGRYHGPHGQRLIDALAAFHEIEFVWPCCSGTFAVELALRALQVGPGDEVILAGYDFGGNFRAVESVGALPVLVDLEANRWTMALDSLETACSERTRVLLVSHLHGGLVDMSKLRDFADYRGLVIVEDACQVPGARVQGRRAGSWGDVGVLSFGGSKLLSAGRGGSILTKHPGVYQRAKIFCERGNDAFPLSELQAGVLLPQLHKLDALNARRYEHVQSLLTACADLPNLAFPQSSIADSRPAYYKVGMFWVGMPGGTTTRETLIHALQAEGIACDAGFRGFLQRSSKRCRRIGELPHARRATEQTIVLHHPVLATDERTVRRLAETIVEVAQAFA